MVRGRFSDHHKVGFLTISRSVFRLYEGRFSGHQLVGKLYLWHKVLEQRIRQFAKDIHTKYIHVPETTDFGIMFLPIEGLYAEVVRRGMVERLQAEFKVVIAGPTTMAALLNSLQMGFKTLAIQKRSSEVWDVLSSVKSEFETFGTALEQAQTRINQAGNALESLVGVRTRQIQRKLRSVTTLPEAGAAGEALEE